MWLQHRLNIKISILTIVIILCTSCALDNTKEFKEVSKTFMGCSMEPPWPVKMTSMNESGATFIRKDEVESPPFNFLTKEIPSWESLPHVQMKLVEIEHYPPFEVVHFLIVNPEEITNFDIKITVIRRNNIELFLPSELSNDWKLLLDSCLENMQD